MIVRAIEICPNCGQYDPWRKGRKGRSLVVDGERRIYVTCRRCGRHDVIVYRPKEPKISPMG